MEQLKDPATLLSIINSIGIAGSTFYFYKQGETFQLNIDKIQQSLTVCVGKNKELDQGYRQLVEGLRLLSEQVKAINGKIEDLPNHDNIRMIDDDLEEIIETLQEHNIDVQLPSRRIRSGDRRDNRNVIREIREIEQDRSLRHVQNSRRHDMSFRDNRDRRPYRDNRDNRRERDDERQFKSELSKSELSNRHSSQDQNEDEIDALIGDVRKQTH